MDTYASECYDSIALFLCIHIIHRYKVIMHQRNTPVLDKSVVPLSNLLCFATACLFVYTVFMFTADAGRMH